MMPTYEQNCEGCRHGLRLHIGIGVGFKNRPKNCFRGHTVGMSPKVDDQSWQNLPKKEYSGSWKFSKIASWGETVLATEGRANKDNHFTLSTPCLIGKLALSHWASVNEELVISSIISKNDKFNTHKLAMTRTNLWLTGVSSDDIDRDRVAAAVQRLVVVCYNDEPIFRVKLNVIAQVLGIRRLRRHRSQTLARPAFLILYLVVLDVVAVRLLCCQQLAAQIKQTLHFYRPTRTHQGWLLGGDFIITYPLLSLYTSYDKMGAIK